jgi:hypothetical protein
LKLTAMNWIEHPSRNGDLEFFGELNYKTLLVELAQSAHHFDFRSIKRVMSIMNLLEREFVCHASSRGWNRSKDDPIAHGSQLSAGNPALP